MNEWRGDPSFAMCAALVDGAELSSFVGGPYDVRVVVAGMRPEVKDGFLLDEVPWGRFPQGDRVKEAVGLLHGNGTCAPGSRVRGGAGVVDGMSANDMRAAAALAVPFLIRIAADAHHRYRAGALSELSSPARARHFGVASRDALLLHRTGSPDDGDYDDYGVEVTGYPAGWSVAAARAAITSDTGLLLPLLGDPEPGVRITAAYALATATDAATDADAGVRSSFRARLDAERDPVVGAALVLAAAEATRARPHPPTAAWLSELWPDRSRPPEVRPAAVIGRLCLTDGPAPEGMRAVAGALATAERAAAMEALPWMAVAGGVRETGLVRCLRMLLNPDEPGPVECDDPWCSDC
ncbi:hypothetical protein ACIGD1_16035 [Streptomyces sp. NPDC085612]|uniref:hypothetical protein n=1 Tax=Streptomyces sp. NPDC085612 TaxID=3365732 RepID=UPI0037D40C5B